jgi:uncharacterized protein YdeI (YjbR/CyaY-like superfamily)
VNKDRLDRLLAAGLVAPAGVAPFAGAKRDGRWSRLDDVDRLTLPDDLAAALGALPSAQARIRR